MKAKSIKKLKSVEVKKRRSRVSQDDIQTYALSYNRKYHYIAILTLHKSRVLSEGTQPKDDIVNWLFLKNGGSLFSFIYKIEEPLKAGYGIPFNVQASFNMEGQAKKLFELNTEYEVWRGQESIGTGRLIKNIE